MSSESSTPLGCGVNSDNSGRTQSVVIVGEHSKERGPIPLRVLALPSLAPLRDSIDDIDSSLIFIFIICSIV